jgi:hypothetical protein
MVLQGILLKANGKVGDAERMFIQVSLPIFPSSFIEKRI